MSSDWAKESAQRLGSDGLSDHGLWLLIGGADTGKTTLAAAIVKRLTGSGPVAIVDADMGQSHIGPPATVGWAIADRGVDDFSILGVRGIAFTGDITPVGHLLQLTGAIVQCVRAASKSAEPIIVDTPGFVSGSAAAALWWEVQRVLQPEVIIAVQRSDELSHILRGLQGLETRIEVVGSLADLQIKSPEERRKYRRKQFGEYFSKASVYNIDLRHTAVQGDIRGDKTARLVGLRGAGGIDLAVGAVEQWHDEQEAVVKAPAIDVDKVRCVVVGKAQVDLGGL